MRETTESQEVSILTTGRKLVVLVTKGNPTPEFAETQYKPTRIDGSVCWRGGPDEPGVGVTL